VLVDITPRVDPAGVSRIRGFMAARIDDGFGSLEEAADAIAAYTPNRARRMRPEGLRKVLRQRDGRWYWHWDPAFISRGRTETVPDRLAGLLEVAMDNVSVPTMLVRGVLSDVVSAEGVDDLLSHIPDATVVDVDGAAHMIAGDRNDAFSEAVIAFLTERIRPALPERWP
jgi:pimeloyl-ACP methyl ester carboxylesterase